ncbi:MAG: aspartate carbamoyltransferase, partial [Nitrospirae bacterium]|nr:aspartate carbamoyltransferase [Nitrospirota bacterium]
EAEKYRGALVIDEAMMNGAKEDAVLLNPLPRVDEVSVEVDSDSRAKYFDQVENGVYVRMALLKKVLG